MRVRVEVKESEASFRRDETDSSLLKLSSIATLLSGLPPNVMGLIRQDQLGGFPASKQLYQESLIFVNGPGDTHQGL
jgi:hypothetical protein